MESSSHRKVLQDIPSNSGLIKVITRKNVSHNRRFEIIEFYKKAFAEQLKQRIISELAVNEINPADCDRIPHKPVIKIGSTDSYQNTFSF